MTTLVEGRPAEGRLSRVTAPLSAAAAWVALVVALVAGPALVASVLANVVLRETVGRSIYGSEEFARFAFLWIIWMGVSLAVRRGAVTVITLASGRGPWWWRASVTGLAHTALGVLLVYACWRSVQYALSAESVDAVSAALRAPFWTAIASMAVGYVFITIHYADALARAIDRRRGRGSAAWRGAAAGAVGTLVLGALLWAVCWVLLQAGAAPLIPLGLVFVVLTLAGMPIVFMLSFVGILGASSILGLGFFGFGGNDPLFPFRTTQSAMGLSTGGELMVIYAFLLVAETMNAGGLSQRLIRLAASVVGHFRGGMAYVSQLVSALLSGISGSAQADAAVMTPLLVPAMEQEGYRRDVAAAVVSGASIKGPVGPISVMFIVYGFIVSGTGAAPIDQMLLTGVVMVLGLLVLQALVISVTVRRKGMDAPHAFRGWDEVGRATLGGLPVLLVPVIILGGIVSGLFTPTESAAVAVAVTILLALAYRGLHVGQMVRALVLAAMETGVVMLLLGDSAILSKLLYLDGFGASLQQWVTGITSSAAAFLGIVIVLLLLVGVFIEPLPALYILAPFLAPLAVGVYGIDPVQFAMVVVLALVLGLIHPPVGLVLFLVASIARVSIERLSLTILPWIGISFVWLLLVAFLPAGFILWFADALT